VPLRTAAHPSTGLPDLDVALGGLLWGDNVVWLVQGASADPFFRSIVASEDDFDVVTWVAVERDPDDVRGAVPDAEVLDARPGTALAQPAALLQAIRRHLDGARRNLLLFDGLEAMADRWGADVAARFFAACCPRLLALGAVAYWSLDVGRGRPGVEDAVRRVTQCIIRVDARTLTVEKAEGRPDTVRGHRLAWTVEDGRARLSPAPIAALVAGSLRTLRQTRGLSQTDLARLAGVTPSAVSQAERGDRGLSLETLLRLADALHMSLDDLLHAQRRTPYRVGRRDDDPGVLRAGSQTLLDAGGWRPGVALVRLPPRGSGAPEPGQHGQAVITVGAGLVQVLVDDATPSLRQGDALSCDAARVTGWRNLGDGDALLFWTVVPPAPERE
jgi:DNA-binding XRE family transcriptional regulator/quercetin dioxygenase-like cupin family protein